MRIAIKKPQFEIEAEAIEILLEGKLGIAPVDVAYGFIAISRDAVLKIFSLKGRSKSKQCVILGCPDLFDELAVISDQTLKEKAKLLTLPVGIVVNLNQQSPLAKTIPPEVVRSGTIAIFMNMGRVGKNLSQRALKKNHVICGSSANLSGEGNSYSVDQIPQEIIDQVDFVIEDEEVPFQARRSDGKGLSSTIVSLVERKITREGLLLSEVKEQALILGLI